MFDEMDCCIWTQKNSETMAHRGQMVLVGLMTLILVFYCEEVNGVDLRANPSVFTIGGQNTQNSRLTISCTPNVPNIQRVLVIELGKKDQFDANSPIVQIFPGDTSVTIVDTGLQQRMTQTGSINGGSGNLEFVLSDLRCTDAATYYCKSTVVTKAFHDDEGTVNVTARTIPEEVTMFPSPDYSQYAPSTKLELTCNGRIGNQFDQNNMANVWVWEWRFVDEFNSQWTTYPNTNNNITFDPPTTAANCQYNARTVLKHMVKSTDNGRQFRCYVVSPEYGGNKTVYTETPPIVGSPCRTGDGTEEGCPIPTAFYCIDHSDSSVTIQWVFNGTKYSSFKFELKFRQDKATSWNTVDTSQQDEQLQILHKVHVTKLQPNSLYFFRLLVDGEQSSQGEGVTATCFTERSLEPDSSSLGAGLGAGVGIGMAVMLLLGSLCILSVFIYRRKGVSRGTKSNTLEHVSPVQRPETGMTQATGDGEYEMPGNFYDGLQGKSVEAPTTYAKLATYQNT